MKGTVYISGAITGVDNFKELFGAAENKLRGLGYKVINPCEVCAARKCESYIDYIIYDLIALKECTHIHFLENADQSDGAQIEKIIARRLGLKVVEL